VLYFAERVPRTPQLLHIYHRTRITVVVIFIRIFKVVAATLSCACDAFHFYTRPARATSRWRSCSAWQEHCRRATSRTADRRIWYRWIRRCPSTRSTRCTVRRSRPTGAGARPTVPAIRNRPHASTIALVPSVRSPPGVHPSR